MPTLKNWTNRPEVRHYVIRFVIFQEIVDEPEVAADINEEEEEFEDEEGEEQVWQILQILYSECLNTKPPKSELEQNLNATKFTLPTAFWAFNLNESR